MKHVIYSLLLLSLVSLQCKKEVDPFVNNTGSYNHNRMVGVSANDLLSNSKYSSLKIEIQYMPGYQPDQAAIDHTVSVLNERLNKPEGVTDVHFWKNGIGKTAEDWDR